MSHLLQSFFQDTESFSLSLSWVLFWKMSIYTSFICFSGVLSSLIWDIILYISILINFLWCGFCSDDCRIIYFVASFVHPLVGEGMMRLLFVSISLYHDWSTEKKRILSLKLWFNRKICNRFLKSRCTLGLVWNFLENTNVQALFFSKVSYVILMKSHFLRTTGWYDDLLLLSSLFHFF